MNEMKNVVPHFSLSSPRVAFFAWGDFHARSRFARSNIPEGKWGLLVVYVVEFSIQECLGLTYMGRNLSSIQTIHQGHNTSFNSGE